MTEPQRITEVYRNSERKLRIKRLDNTPKIMYNNSEVKKNLMAQFSEALNIVLERGFGRIKVKIDAERGVYRVTISKLLMRS